MDAGGSKALEFRCCDDQITIIPSATGDLKDKVSDFPTTIRAFFTFLNKKGVANYSMTHHKVKRNEEGRLDFVKMFPHELPARPVFVGPLECMSAYAV